MKIERDTNGEPTGVFIDYNYPRKIPVRGWPGAILGFPAIPGPAEGGAVRAVRSGMQAFNRVGITAIYEGHGMPANVIAAYRELHASRELSVRAYCPIAFPVPAYYDAALADRIIAIGEDVAGGNFVGDDLLRIGGLGFSFDSAAGAGNSLMHAPYRGTQGQIWNGVQLASDEQLRAAIRKTAQAGLRVQIQCTGDAAIDKVLAIFEEINRETPLLGKRWVIEHCQFPSGENMAACSRLGVVATSVVSFLWDYGNVYVAAFGEEVADRAIPYRSWIDAGVMLANSSDGHPYEATFCFWEMLARKAGYGGRTMGPSQRITRAEALRASTLNGAYAMFWEDRIGSIEPGKLADVAIFSADIMTIPEDEILTATVVATLLGGGPFTILGSSPKPWPQECSSAPFGLHPSVAPGGNAGARYLESEKIRNQVAVQAREAPSVTFH